MARQDRTDASFPILFHGSKPYHPKHAEPRNVLSATQGAHRTGELIHSVVSHGAFEACFGQKLPGNFSNTSLRAGEFLDDSSWVPSDN